MVEGRCTRTKVERWVKVPSACWQSVPIMGQRSKHSVYSRSTARAQVSPLLVKRAWGRWGERHIPFLLLGLKSSFGSRSLWWRAKRQKIRGLKNNFLLCNSMVMCGPPPCVWVTAGTKQLLHVTLVFNMCTSLSYSSRRRLETLYLFRRYCICILRRRRLPWTAELKKTVSVLVYTMILFFVYCFYS